MFAFIHKTITQILIFIMAVVVTETAAVVVL